MALTITFDTPSAERIARNLYQQTGYIAFDSSYAFGGESIASITGRFRNCLNVVCEQKQGYLFEFDKTNSKLKAFTNAPAIVINEQQTIASNQITLNYPAAFIFGMATATATQLLTDASATLTTSEVKPTAAFSWGTRPTFTFHSGTSGAVKTSYITQAWKEVFDNRTVVTKATASNVANLGVQACLIETCRAVGTTGTNRSKFIKAGDTVATLEAELDWTDAATSNTTTLTFVNTDVITSAVVTYVAIPASGFIKERWIEEESITISSQVGATAYPILVPALCAQMPDSHAAGARAPHHLGMPEGDALGTGQEFRIDNHLCKTLAGHQVAVNDATTDTTKMTYIYGLPFEVPNLVPLEVPNGQSLSSLTAVRFIATGLK